MKYFARIIALVAIAATSAASVGCVWFLIDEPKAPKSICD